MEKYNTGAGQKMTVHSKEDCKTDLGDYCSVHNPSMTWPTLWRSDWGGFMEYTCPCGVGYPAPEADYKHPGFGTCGKKECHQAYRDACKKVEDNAKEKEEKKKDA